MRKIKVVLLIILAGVRVDFAYENRQPALVIKLFSFQWGELPQFLVIYVSLAVGVVIGWGAHGLRIRRRRRESQAAPTVSAQQQESQEGQGGRQDQ